MRGSRRILRSSDTVVVLALRCFSVSRDIMGDFTIGSVLRVLARIGAATVLRLNFGLLADAFWLAMPFLE